MNMDIKITDILSPKSIGLNIEARDKTEALHQMVELLVAGGAVPDKMTLISVILERERLMSTGIGNGVALPHGKTSAVDRSLAALATLQSPIDFDSLDDKPVSIILLLVGTESNVGVHLRLLSRISRMVGNEQFRSAIMSAKSVDDVLQLLSSYEEERV